MYLLVDPQSKLDWQHDWSSWLTEGDSIAARQWSISPIGPTLTGATSQAVTASGWVAGNVYRLTEHIVTVNGLEADRSIVIRASDL